MVGDAVAVLVVVVLARRVADRLKLVPLEERARLEARAARVGLRLGVGAAALTPDDPVLEVLGEEVPATRLWV